MSYSNINHSLKFTATHEVLWPNIILDKYGTDREIVGCLMTLYTNCTENLKAWNAYG
jgi:hypothetical protein